MRINHRPVLALIASILVVAGCAAGDGTGVDEGDATVNAGAPLRVGHAPFLSQAPVVIAAEAGLFEQHGLAVELVELRSSRDSLTLFVREELDAWVGINSPGIFNAIAAGENIRIVAAREEISAEGCASAAIVVRSDVLTRDELETPGDLEGLRIGGDFAFLTSNYFLDRTLDHAGLGHDDVEAIEVDNAARAGALDSGTIDAAMVYEPWVSQVLATVDARVWKSAAEVIPGFQNSFLFYGSRLLDDEPELGDRFMRAYLDAVSAYGAGPTEDNLRILEGPLGLDAGVLETACWPTMSPDGRLDEEGIIAQQEFAVTLGQMDEVVPVEQLWDPSFVERAVSAREGNGG